MGLVLGFVYRYKVFVVSFLKFQFIRRKGREKSANYNPNNHLEI